MNSARSFSQKSPEDEEGDEEQEIGRKIDGYSMLGKAWNEMGSVEDQVGKEGVEQEEKQSGPVPVAAGFSSGKGQLQPGDEFRFQIIET